MNGYLNKNEHPIAVLGSGDTLTTRLLQRLTDWPVVKLTPCQAALDDRAGYRAVVVENFDHYDREALSGCAVARWKLAHRTNVTVVGLDDEEGRRLVAAAPGAVFSYSDGQPQADLSAKNVRMSAGRIEFEALTDRELLRVKVGVTDSPRLYDYLAALAGALALGIPLEWAAARLTEETRLS